MNNGTTQTYRYFDRVSDLPSNPTDDLTGHERMLVSMYRALPKEDKAAILRIMRPMVLASVAN